MKKWTIVTVAYNSAAPLREYWSQNPIPSTVEWVVVDNNSADDSADLAESLGATVIRNPVNVGFGTANNYGFQAGDAPYVLFANPDVRVDFSTLDVLEEWLTANSDDLVSPQLENLDGSLQPNGRGAARLPFKILNRVAPEFVARRYSFLAEPHEALSVDWLMGAAVGGRRKRFDLLGPWDPEFFVYYEDSDLGMRNAAAGGRSVVLGAVRWVHGWARETKSRSWAAWRLEIDSMRRFYKRYPALLLPPLDWSDSKGKRLLE